MYVNMYVYIDIVIIHMYIYINITVYIYIFSVYVIYIYIYIYIYIIYTHTQTSPWSDYPILGAEIAREVQETFLARSADNQTRNYDTDKVKVYSDSIIWL